jgi:hypothetical protein
MGRTRKQPTGLPETRIHSGRRSADDALQAYFYRSGAAHIFLLITAVIIRWFYMLLQRQIPAVVVSLKERELECVHASKENK